MDEYVLYWALKEQTHHYNIKQFMAEVLILFHKNGDTLVPSLQGMVWFKNKHTIIAFPCSWKRFLSNRLEFRIWKDPRRNVSCSIICLFWRYAENIEWYNVQRTGPTCGILQSTVTYETIRDRNLVSGAFRTNFLCQVCVIKETRLGCNRLKNNWLKQECVFKIQIS